MTAVRAIAIIPGQPNSLHRTTIEVPEPDHNQVAISVIRVGVCGTDREILQGDIGFAPQGLDTLVIGHEVIGRVDAVGDAVMSLEPGDLVTVSVRRPDGCPACQAGEPDMCLWHDYTERGISGAQGFMAERIVEDESYVIRIPDELEAIGVLTEPLSVVEKAVRQAELIQRRLKHWNLKTALVMGAGPIGILGTLILRSKGIDVCTFARTPAPNPAAAIIEAAGATYISTREESAADLAKRLEGIDLIIESTGASSVVFESMQVLGNNGVLVLLSVTTGHKTLEVAADQINTSLVLGNKVVVGSVNAGSVDFVNAVERLGRFEELWPGLTGRMITHRLTVDDDLTAIARKDEGVIKMVVEFSSASGSAPAGTSA
jgi:threonine dehydrogenase-like Zn-dependent dehydrogenase